MKLKRLQEWERQIVLDGYLRGDKLDALAAEFNCSTGTISMLAKRRGLPRRKLGWKGASRKRDLA